MPPDVSNLLGGKEDVVFPKLKAAAEQCIEDGADVICMGSTTMHQAVRVPAREPAGADRQPRPAHLQARGDSCSASGSRRAAAAYPSPRVPKYEMLAAMLEGAAATETATA